MTVREMHIEIRQGANKVAANRVRKLQNEELDFAINKISNRYKRSLLRLRKDGSGGFEIDQIGADSLRTLIVSDYTAPAYFEASRGCYRFILPPDYEYLLGDWSYTTPLYRAPMPDLTAVTLYLNYIRQNYSLKGSTPYYVTETVTIGSSSFALPADLPYGHTYTGEIKKEDVMFLTPLIASRKQWYWEYFGNDYFPASFLHPSASSEVSSMVTDSGSSIAGSTRQYTLYTHPGSGERVSNRLTSTAIIPDMKGTAFYKSTAQSPVSELNGRELNIYSDNSFTIARAGISYIRKSVPVSLNLGCNSELPESVHSVICDLVIEYLLSSFNTPNVQFKQQDIATRVTI